MTPKSSTPRKPNAAPPAVSWPALYHLLRRRAWLLITCLVVAAMSGAAWLSKTPKIYAARTVVQVEQSEQQVINIQSIAPEDLSTMELLKTIEQNFMSSDLLLRAVKNSGLATDPRFLQGAAPGALSDDSLLRRVSNQISVKLRRGTRLIDITAQHTSPEVAQILAQSLVKEYLRQGFEQRVATSKMANSFLFEEAARLKAKVESSEQKLQEYRERHDAVSLEDKQNITVETLRELNSTYTEARGARMRLEAEFAQTRELLVAGQTAELLQITSVAAAPTVMEAKKALSDKQLEIATLSQRYREEHPKYIQAQSQLRKLTAEFELRVRKAAETVGTLFEAAQMTEKKFQEALAAQQKRALELNRLEIPYNSLIRDVESDQAMYQAVLKRLKETEVAKGVETTNLRLVESARLPNAPISPVPMRIMILSVLAGLVIGVVLVALLNMLDTSVRTVDDAEQHLGLTAYAAIPHSRSVESAENSLALIAEPESAIAEAFRTLRTSLVIKNGEDARVVLFTSAVPAEGKSFCSANAAVSFAQLGHKTLLIDADLRRPSLGKMFKEASGPRGLSEYLDLGTPLTELIHTTRVSGLDLLSAGKVAHNPAELLKSSKLAELFRDPLLQGYDRIIVDSAPVNAVSDTLNLVQFAQAICLVIRSNKTPKRALLRAYHELVEAGGRSLGLIVNRLPHRGGAGYYYYYSAGAYGSEGVYGAKAVAGVR